MARNTLPPTGRDLPDSGGQESLEKADDHLKTNLAEEIEEMIKERLLSRRWVQDYSVDEIAMEVQLWVLNNLSRTIEESGKGKPKMQRLEAFRALRTRLQLTSGAARQWQEVINEARR